MRLKFLESIAGPSWHYKPGEVHEVGEEMALLYLKHGFAVPADPDTEDAAAMAGDPNATRPRVRRRGEDLE